MSEPVTSPSLLTITAPPEKLPRATTEDFGKQLQSLAENDKSRSPSKEEDVKIEKSSATETAVKKDTPADTEQETVSSSESTIEATKDDAVDGREVEVQEKEETTDSLTEELIVTAPVIGLIAVPEELLIVDTVEEIVPLAGDDAIEQAVKPLDLETPDERAGEQLPEKPALPITEGIATEEDAPEAKVAAAEVVAKRTGEQELATSAPVLDEEENGTKPTATDDASGGPSTGEKKENKARSEPSLLAKVNKTAIKGDAQEPSGTEKPIEKPIEKPLASLPVSAAVAAASTKVESVSTDETRGDTNEGTTRNLTMVNAAEERANQRSELAAAAKTRTNSAPTIDPSRFVSRVAKAFEAAQQQGGVPIRLRLSPPELGMLQVQIEVKEGVLTASLEAETHAARNLLLENLPALRDRLAEQQISIEKFDVNVQDESSGNEYEQADSHESDADAQSDRQSRRNSNNGTSARTAQSTTEDSTNTPSTISFDNDRVDLVA